MADDANALTQPERLLTEADYEAICATVMQTERGRWFLAEFTKRNRNADTRMVLDAVDRIEASMARTAQPTPAEQTPVDHGPAIAAAMAKARARAAEIAACTTETAEIVHGSVQALREITWTLREWGTDSGLCDQLDAHVTAIAESSEAATRAASAEAMQAVFEAPSAGEIAVAAVLPQPVEVVPSMLVDALAPVVEERVAAPSAVAVLSNVTAAVAALKPQTLGAALLDQGLVAPPRGSDPLAPLRRMTQAEKIALFT